MVFYLLERIIQKGVTAKCDGGQRSGIRNTGELVSGTSEALLTTGFHSGVFAKRLFEADQLEAGHKGEDQKKKAGRFFHEFILALNRFLKKTVNKFLFGVKWSFMNFSKLLYHFKIATKLLVKIFW